MSVLLAEVMERSGRTEGDALAGHSGFGLASITAGLARICEQGVAPDPVPDEPAHAVVFGKKTQAVKRRLAKEAVWVIKPQGDFSQE